MSATAERPIQQVGRQALAEPRSHEMAATLSAGIEPETIYGRIPTTGEVREPRRAPTRLAGRGVRCRTGPSHGGAWTTRFMHRGFSLVPRSRRGADAPPARRVGPLARFIAADA